MRLFAQAAAFLVLTISLQAFSGEFVSFDNVVMDSEYKDGMAQVNYGHLILEEDEVTLSLQRPWSCPEGALCSAVMPQPYEFNAKIVKKEVDNCGIKTITAEKNLMPVDGEWIVIEITDYSEMVCDLFVLSQVKVEFFHSWIDRFNWTQPELESSFYSFQGFEQD